MSNAKVTVTPGTPKDPTQTGILYLRRPKGRNYTFLVGGPSYDRAAASVNWTEVQKQGNLVFWAGDEGVFEVKQS